MTRIIIILLCCLTFNQTTKAQHSIARDWNEFLLESIRKDYARPTVHARNLFHAAILMYDAWAIFDDQATTVFLGQQYGGYSCNFNGIATPSDVEQARHEIISYAMYRLINQRFSDAPDNLLERLQNAFISYGYDPDLTTTNYSSGSYAALGNYLASEIIAFGMQDGSNQHGNYENRHYTPSNDPLSIQLYLDNTNINPNRWQPISFAVFIDQSGNIFNSNTPDFLSPEWGEVTPFALKTSELQILNSDFECYVYNDPGPPVYIQDSAANGIDDPYKWHFSLVASWSSHLDPDDPTVIDISPASLGNIAPDAYPTSFEDYKSFYNFENGGDIGEGYAINPISTMPYTPQLVKRADYARCLAEFWADGPDSETPPGHWFTILNYVSDHPQTIKKLKGEGPVLNTLEWDVKSYLALAGAMHDVAINTWGIKGFYDYIRPISAIRYMAGKGQSTAPELPSFDPHGLPLIDGLSELIIAGDPLAGAANENVGQLKIKAWKGPDFITNPATDIAGVDWTLGTHWWPYQRGTFVTPPFAGYLSGHSTFSSAAAEVLEHLTGSAFFPGGMGIFEIEKEKFLVFEKGPSESLTLQWATYKDASDQSSLSRIWGGIHPPIDDIKGRILGTKIGTDAFELAEQHFNGNITLNTTAQPESVAKTQWYPTTIERQLTLSSDHMGKLNIQFFTMDGREAFKIDIDKKNRNHTINIPMLAKGVYSTKVMTPFGQTIFIEKVIKK